MFFSEKINSLDIQKKRQSIIGTQFALLTIRMLIEKDLDRKKSFLFSSATRDDYLTIICLRKIVFVLLHANEFLLQFTRHAIDLSYEVRTSNNLEEKNQ